MMSRLLLRWPVSAGIAFGLLLDARSANRVVVLALSLAFCLGAWTWVERDVAVGIVTSTDQRGGDWLVATVLRPGEDRRIAVRDPSIVLTATGDRSFWVVATGSLSSIGGDDILLIDRVHRWKELPTLDIASLHDLPVPDLLGDPALVLGGCVLLLALTGTLLRASGAVAVGLVAAFAIWAGLPMDDCVRGSRLSDVVLYPIVLATGAFATTVTFRTGGRVAASVHRIPALFVVAVLARAVGMPDGEMLGVPLAGYAVAAAMAFPALPSACLYAAALTPAFELGAAGQLAVVVSCTLAGELLRTRT